MGKARRPLAENIFLNAGIIADRKGIKSGELESRCGVSAGYFSRAAKNGTSPGIDIVIRMARALNTTVDILCNCPPEYNQENVVLIHDFAAKLICKTIEGKVTWEGAGDSLTGTIEGLESLRPIVRMIPYLAKKPQYQLSVMAAGHKEVLLDTEKFTAEFMRRTMEDLYGTAANAQNIPQEVRDIIDSYMGGTQA